MQENIMSNTVKQKSLDLMDAGKLFAKTCVTSSDSLILSSNNALLTDCDFEFFIYVVVASLCLVPC